MKENGSAIRPREILDRRQRFSILAFDDERTRWKVAVVVELTGDWDEVAPQIVLIAVERYGGSRNAL